MMIFLSFMILIYSLPAFSYARVGSGTNDPMAPRRFAFTIVTGPGRGSVGRTAWVGMERAAPGI